MQSYLSSSVLSMNSPVQSRIANSTYSFYKAFWGLATLSTDDRATTDGTTTDTVIFRTTLTELSGHVQAFVSCTEQYPTASTEGVTVLEPDLSHILDIPGLVLRASGCTPTGYVHIGVRAMNSTSASYSIEVSTLTETAEGESNGNTAFSVLRPGLPSFGIVKYERFKYYYVALSEVITYQDLKISIAPGQGEVQVYVGMLNLDLVLVTHSMPTQPQSAPFSPTQPQSALL